MDNLDNLNNLCNLDNLDNLCNNMYKLDYVYNLDNLCEKNIFYFFLSQFSDNGKESGGIWQVCRE